MPRPLIILIVILLVLHQDNWFWNDEALVFGFIPIGLFYHACISIAASVVWFYAVKKCWPRDVESLAQADSSEGGAA